MSKQLDDRSREILRLVIDAYLATGEPVGSKTLSMQLGMALSPASIRNVMASLEDIGLLFSPHTSAGRLPTDLGLRFFVDGLLETGSLTKEEEQSIRAKCKTSGLPFGKLLEEATSQLSGLSNYAGLVAAPKTQSTIKHIEFVSLEPGKALVVMVTHDGNVENRIIEIPMGLPVSALQEASNYINARAAGRRLDDVLARVREDLAARRQELDTLTQKVISEGLAVWVDDGSLGSLIVKGQANLLQHMTAFEDLGKIQTLFRALEARETVVNLLQATEKADGIQIYIGAENELFGMTGCSMVISPFKNTENQIVGAIGVIGPTRMNYARIIPMVDYTAKVITKLIEES